MLLILKVENIQAQIKTREIKGQVRSGGEAVPFATVGLLGTTQGTSTDENGFFRLDKLATGNYQLQVSGVGYQKVNKLVKVQVEEITLNINLNKSEQALQEVVVTGTMKETFASLSPVPIAVYTPKMFQKTPRPVFLRPCKW